ncbi:unnamed protein product [Ectocarpus sp. CCAP 1310/34]|nr:unnamed protein product [Ectocarpus sp. CCAP 1310/34]
MSGNDAPRSKSIDEQTRADSRRRRQERKNAQLEALQTGVWERCLYRVPGKARYCAQHSASFCGTHMGETAEKGKRVPCPVDPNHTVFEQQLSSHVKRSRRVSPQAPPAAPYRTMWHVGSTTKVCNLALQQARMVTQPYYSEGINSGPPLLPGEEEEEKNNEKEEDRGDVAVVAAVGAAADLDDAFVVDLLSRVEAAHRHLVGEIPTEVLDPPEVQALHRGLVGPTGAGGESGHGEDGPSVLHVEMGAGKGTLGQSIATAFPGSDVTMVERSSVRRKAENRLEGVSTRARIDIRDLDMGGLPSLTAAGDDRPVVAVAKHLCGVATDLALRRDGGATDGETNREKHQAGHLPFHLLVPRHFPPWLAVLALSLRRSLPNLYRRAMLTLPPRRESRDADDGGHVCNGDPTDAPAAATTRVGGVAIATCCHHVCNWRDYVGRDFLMQQGFSARDFEAMRRISAWISLEPDAGARKNNRYPDDRHPGVTFSLSFPRKIPGETASVAAGSLRPAAETRKLQPVLEPGGGDGPWPGEREADSCSGGGPGEAREGIWTEQFSGEGENSLERAGETNGGHSSSSPWHATAAPSLNMSASTPSSLQLPTSDNANASTSIGDGSEVLVPLTPSEKAAAARGCKRLLDRGRRAFIEERLGLCSEIVHFVGSDVTPENALLLGFRAEDGP